jgi:preprotein translocase subunit SecD
MLYSRYPTWKYILILGVSLLGFLYALPNVYGEDPALQISANKPAVITEQTQALVQQALSNAKLSTKSLGQEGHSLVVRFVDTDTQFKAKEVVEAALGEQYAVASNFASASPAWLSAIGAEPMKLGLDLRGGIHLLLEVDLDGVIARREEGLQKTISDTLRAEHIRYTQLSRSKTQGVTMTFASAEAQKAAKTLLLREQPDLLVSDQNQAGVYALTARLSPQALDAIRRSTIEQTKRTLDNRVNELGVGETIVQQQGANRIAVDLPGIQDAVRAKEILGGTATLEFHMENQQDDAATAKSSGIVPLGSRLYDFEGRPILIYNTVILSGEAIGSAMPGTAQDGSPSVDINLSGDHGLFTRTTRQNIGKRMSIIYIETKSEVQLVEGKPVRTSHKVERVISNAVIKNALDGRFTITGLSAEEARDLSLLLRAGALVATIYPVEERIVGASLGKENIRAGIISLAVGMGVILVLMAVYYRLFGLIANVALLMNLVLLTAVLSLLHATMTLPGIAGMVLTVGMAVDANVLIYERIREELRHRMTPLAAIQAGYDRAFATIIDANVSALIVAIVLYAMGSGPLRAFAIVLGFGLLTSMLTAITFTRALVGFIYGRGKRVTTLSIGKIVVPTQTLEYR